MRKDSVNIEGNTPLFQKTIMSNYDLDSLKGNWLVWNCCAV